MPSHTAKHPRINKGRLVGIAEIARIAKVSRARAGQIANFPWFPPYYEHMDMGTCWPRAAVVKALNEHGWPKDGPLRPLADVKIKEDAEP